MYNCGHINPYLVARQARYCIFYQYKPLKPWLFFLDFQFVIPFGSLDIECYTETQQSKYNLQLAFICYSPLHMLILNAGVLSPPHTITEDGFELNFQVNYLAHHYLCRLLEHILKRSAPSRIVNVSSEAHRLAGALFVPSFQHPNPTFQCQIVFIDFVDRKSDVVIAS